MTDFNEDGTHESVVEKHDLTGDGEYNVFKYGYVDSAGEISYRTIVSQANPSQTLIDKKESVSQTEWFELKDSLGNAQRTLYTTTIINNTIEKAYYSVQSDVDLDGLMDEETSLEVIYNNIQVTTYTKEITEVKESGILEELRVSTFEDSSMSQTMVFTDIVSDEVVSTRVYEDAFPNELTELNNVDNYLISVMSETISSQTPDLNSLFSIAHSIDNVPAEFDRVTTIENGEITTDNLLFTTQTISIPGVYSENGQGLGSYSIEAIKSIPAEGTRWINDPKGASLPAEDEGGYYLYFDSSDDGTYETVFVVDENDKVVGIGFDYDQDSRFNPAKTIPVLKQVLWSENYQGISFENDYIHFGEEDKEIGIFNEPTFSDVLFDVFLMDFSGDSSELIELAEGMATNQFEEEVTPLTMVGDIAQQVIAGLAGLAAGALATCAPHLGFMVGYLGTSLAFQSIKINEQEQFIAHRTFVLDTSDGEKVLGSKFWFDDMFGNVLPITIFGSVGGVYAPAFLETNKYSYSSDIILREFNAADPKASSLTTSYAYPTLDYWLSTRNLAGYSDFDEHFMTDFLHKEGILNSVVRFFGPAEYNHAESSKYYSENQVREETSDNGDTYLDTIFPTIDYTDDGFSPRFSFADSTGSLPTPEFYAPYPVFTSGDSSMLDDYCSIYKLIPMDHPEEVTSIEVQLFDGDIGLKSDIVSVDAYIAWSNREQADELASVPGRSPDHVTTLEEGDFEFDPATGRLTVPLNAKLAQILNSLYFEIQRVESEPDSSGCSYYVIFQVKIEKYRSIDDLRDLTSEQVNKIATAQAIEASILEYNYQFNLAVQTQMSYHELFYTAIVTAVSTAITMGATLGVGKVVESLAKTYASKELSKSASKTLLGLLQPTAGFSASGLAYDVLKEIGQEVLIDPWIESAVSGMVRRAGGDAMLQMVLSSVAESLRETLTGPFTNLLSPQQSEGVSLYEQLDAKYFSNGLKPTAQDLLTAFNEYKTEIETQIQLRKDQTTNLGRGFKALTFVLGAVGFGVAQFIGPPTSLIYATLTTFCFTEGISLKGMFKKAFNPVMIAASKVGDFARYHEKEVLLTLGIGVASIGLIALQVLLPSLVTFGWLGLGVPIAIGMVKYDKVTNKEEIVHYTRWLTDRIKNYLDILDNKIKFLFDPYNSFTKMCSLLGLSKTSLSDQRRAIHAKKIIAQSVLNSMSSSLRQKVESWTKEYPELSDLLFEACSDLISFIDDYQKLLKPKPTPRYQMYDHHPNFIRNYFSEITDSEQAYWLGFLVADGYIGIEHKKSGDYYRMGIGLSEKDQDILFKFCEAVGLNPEYIKTRDVYCSFTGEYTPISEIRWGDQSFAKDLIELGIQYEEVKGRRVKVATMPNFENKELALAYLLGFYDGDGSLGLNKKDKSIYPTIISTNELFLTQIKKYFGITSSIKSTFNERYDHKRDKIVRTKIHTLYLGIQLFKNMLENYGESLKRKRVSLERLDHYGVSSTRHWLRKVFTKDLLQQMLEVMSPNKIGEILGVKGETIVRFAKDEYGISIPKSGGEYQSIQHSLRNLGEASKFYSNYFYWSNFLGGLKKTPKFGDFPFVLSHYYEQSLIEELISKDIKVDETKLIAIVRNLEGRIIWLERGTESIGFTHILARHDEGFNTMFGIADDPLTIGNFIFNAISRLPIYKTLPGAGGQSKFYVYRFRIEGETIYLHVLVHEDGSIITAYPSIYSN